MSDPKSGTPEPTPQAANNAGTAGGGQDGGEAASAKPVDPALAMAWKQKAEDYNRLQDAYEAERKAREQLEAAQAAQFQQQPQSEAANEVLVKLQRDAAAGDYLAQSTLYTLQAAQMTAYQSRLALDLAVVPEALRETVRNIVEQSGYRVSVAEARKQAEDMARGKQYGDLEQRLAALEAENKRLKEASEARGRTVSTAVVPAAAPEPGSYDMAGSEYRAALARGGPEAIALRRAADSGQKRIDWSR